MIPTVVASEVTGALRDFFAAGCGPSSPALAGVVDDFLADPENLVKGPYLSVAFSSGVNGELAGEGSMDILSPATFRNGACAKLVQHAIRAGIRNLAERSNIV